MFRQTFMLNEHKVLGWKEKDASNFQPTIE